jgi:hypothetical protein
MNRKIKPNQLVVGERYEWTSGAEHAEVTYVGLRRNHPEIQSGQKVGNGGYLFKFDDGKYVDVGMGAILQGWILRREEMALGGQFADPGMQSGGTTGGIPNNYEGKTAEEVWNAWNYDQRRHFLSDHWDAAFGACLESDKHFFDNIAKAGQYASVGFSQLPAPVRSVVEEHISMGQYANGGNILPPNAINPILTIEDGGIYKNIYLKAILGV